MVKDAIPAFDGSLYFVHVILLICLDFRTLVQGVHEVDWAFALHELFDFCNMKYGVSLTLMGKRKSYRCGGDELLDLEGTDEFVVPLPRRPSEFEEGYQEHDCVNHLVGWWWCPPGVGVFDDPFPGGFQSCFASV